MFINIRHNCAFQENPKVFYNFCVSELYIFKVLTQKEIMVTQISAASPSPNFHWGKSYVKKISVYFLAICANFPCKTEKFELENIGAGILGTGFCFQGSQ